MKRRHFIQQTAATTALVTLGSMALQSFTTSANISGAWLSGVHAKPTEGADIQAGVTIDQLAARRFEKETQLASLELAIEPTNLTGACDVGFSCAYVNTVSWRTPTTPLPTENNPRALFERLFGDNDTTDASVRLEPQSQSAIARGWHLTWILSTTWSLTSTWSRVCSNGWFPTGKVQRINRGSQAGFILA